MIPAHVNDAPPPVYDDSFDIPVLLRDGPARRPHLKWRTAVYAPWPAAGTFPDVDGWYAPSTTWREIVKAATEVGRDVSPNLVRVPQLAHGELVARVAPLYAYIGLHDFVPKHPLPHTVGRRLTLNAIYEYATERTAKNALGYRLGMTMAEWACRSLMGLGQTWHIEDGGPIPALRDAFKDPARKLPDLWGLHEAEKQYWLVEAKGGNVLKKTLDEGWEQLEGGSKILSAYAHRRVLVGAAVRPQGDLFLTIDHDQHPGLPPLDPQGATAPTGPGSPEDHIGDDDDALMATARAQMLTYLALKSAPPGRLKTVPVPADRTNRRRVPGALTTPLEADGETRARRADLRGAAASGTETPLLRELTRKMGLDDFLTCRIPGTEVVLGMSRRLFAACEQLHEADRLIAESTPGLRAEDQPHGHEPLDEDAEEEARRARRLIFREQQDEARPRLRPLVRQAYEQGDTRPWSAFLPSGQEPRLNLASDPGLLEAATAETYLAVRREDLPHHRR
ncbi:gamma-glutamyltransferase [Streptomyces macrosporus]|uniref:Gamma-glutamyltransferase n=1 Tax=Streptomyces macrosporus TaxID=44032 RepID=A0ABP5XVZ4_9ACTN